MPIQLQVGDRLTDETGEYEVIGRPYDLRHTFASWLTMKGRPLKEVQELLGHKSITQTEQYSHLALERLRDAVATLDFNTTSAQSPVAHAQVAVTITGCSSFLVK